MQALNRLRGKQTGQVAIMGAGFFAILLVFLAVALYLGMGYTQRRGLQNAADAAALAGAQELDGTPGRVAAATAAAQAYIDNNISGLSGFSITVGDSFTSITVVVEKELDSRGLSSFGLTDADIGARAKAAIRSAPLPGPGSVPVAINEDTWLECESGGNCDDVTLKEFSGNNSDPRSNYQLLSIDGRGANEVCASLIGGSRTSITDPVETKPGNVSSLHNCLILRMDAAKANGCLSEAEVLDDNGVLEERCHPLGGAGRGANPDYPDAQPTSVVLIPVIAEFCQGRCDQDIIQPPGSEVRIFALFRIHESTVYGPNPTCAPPGGGGGGGGKGKGGGPGGGGSGQCWITGEFIDSYLTLLLPSGSTDITDFDPDGLLKVVQLVE